MPRGHYTRRHKGCKVEECIGRHRARGYCDNHLRQFYKYGEQLGPGRGRGPRPNRRAK